MGKPRIIDAKKDAHARRFYNKNAVTCDDLFGAVSFWVGLRAPVNSLMDFLCAIEPPSKWIEDPDHDPGQHRTRTAREYGPDFKCVIAGYWDKWETKHD